jgi:hypothetical protein
MDKAIEVIKKELARSSAPGAASAQSGDLEVTLVGSIDPKSVQDLRQLLSTEKPPLYIQFSRDSGLSSKEEQDLVKAGLANFSEDHPDYLPLQIIQAIAFNPEFTWEKAPKEFKAFRAKLDEINIEAGEEKNAEAKQVQAILQKLYDPENDWYDGFDMSVYSEYWEVLRTDHTSAFLTGNSELIRDFRFKDFHFRAALANGVTKLTVECDTDLKRLLGTNQDPQFTDYPVANILGSIPLQKSQLEELELRNLNKFIPIDLSCLQLYLKDTPSLRTISITHGTNISDYDHEIPWELVHKFLSKLAYAPSLESVHITAMSIDWGENPEESKKEAREVLKFLQERHDIDFNLDLLDGFVHMVGHAKPKPNQEQAAAAIAFLRSIFGNHPSDEQLIQKHIRRDENGHVKGLCLAGLPWLTKENLAKAIDDDFAKPGPSGPSHS